jgi:PAS domain S-box-containing protein
VIDSPYLFLVYNTSLLLTLVLIIDVISDRWKPGQASLKQIPLGIMIGIIGIIVMQTHWKLEDGAIFDTRSILLGITGLFFGTIPTAMTIIVTSLFRYFQGGVGVLTGILVIFASGGIGLLWRHLQKKELKDYAMADFYLFGIAIHVVMILLMFTFPWSIALNVLRHIALPVLIIYPLGTMVLGMLMTHRLQRDALAQTVKDDEIKFKIIAEHAYDWDYWVAPDHRFLYCSVSCQNITGYSADEFMREPELMQKIILPEDVEAFEKHRHSADERKAGQLEFRIKRKDGAVRWIGHVCVPVYGSNNEFLGTRGSNRDVSHQKETELAIEASKNEINKLLRNAEQSRKALLSVVEDQKIAQEKIVKLNEELEERVRQRTEELERTNKELEAFAYSVSHDLRAPLRAINGFTKILHTEHHDALPDDAKVLLQDILNNTKQMSLLIEDLLELSRLSRKEMIKDTIDMENLFRQMFDEVLRHNHRHDIRCTIHDLPDAYGDLILIRQIVNNLLSNAVKFTGKCPHPELTINGRIENDRCVYSVADNGAGFDPRYKNKLFGVFQRLHRTDEFEGTGVGLAIVKRIVERHGGTVGAESELNKGATFYFSIPIHT